jgi:5-methylcytosine-specific restriction endonuclease McrA
MATLNLPDFTPGQPAATVDAALRQALAACDRAQRGAVLWFAEVQRRELFRPLGFASLQLYAVHVLGFSDNRYWQFKRLADDLDRLPVLREAVAAGDVGWTKARQVARVATAATQEQWVARAKVVGKRDLEREVAGALGRARARRKAAAEPPLLALVPGQVAAPEADPPTTIALRADGLQLARFEALVERARKRRLAAKGSDRIDVVLAALEAWVGGEAARADVATHPPVQVVVHQCPDCGRAAAVTSRGEKRLAPGQVAALACDARVREPGRRNRTAIAPQTRAAVLARDRHRCAAPGCGSTSFLEVHHVTPRARGGTNEAANLVTLCHRCHAFAHERHARGREAGVLAGGDSG